MGVRDRAHRTGGPGEGIEARSGAARRLSIGRPLFLNLLSHFFFLILIQVPPAPPEIAEWGYNTMMVASFGALYAGVRDWRVQAAGE